MGPLEFMNDTLMLQSTLTSAWRQLDIMMIAILLTQAGSIASSAQKMNSP